MMKVKQYLWVVISMLLGASPSLFAGVNTLVDYRDKASITAGTILTVKEITGPGTPQSQVNYTHNLVRLVYTRDQQTDNLDNGEWTYKVNYKYYLTGSPGNATFGDVEISFLDENLQPIYEDVAKQSTVSSDVTLEVLSVEATHNGNTVSPTDPAIPGDIRLELETQFSRFYFLDAVNSPLDLTFDNQTYTLHWAHVSGADEYELEYVFIDAQDVAPNPLSPFAYKQATRITTSHNAYKLDMTYPEGDLYFRIRAVGRYINNVDFNFSIGRPNYDHLKRTEWHYGVGNSSTSPLTHNIAPGNGFQAGLNWQYLNTFAEDGKHKSVVSFYDGSFRNRQQQTNLSTEELTIVGETKYDYEGRGVVQILPVPKATDDLNYVTGFNKVDNATLAPFEKEHFDLGTGAANTNKLSSTSGAGQYYSSGNPFTDVPHLSSIPDANGYAYTQVQYTRDGRGNVAFSGGLGETLRLGSDHDNEFYYGTPNSTELHRMFGDNVGESSHYKKNMAIDANGQITITYLDQEGRTVATALAGDSPDNVVAIDQGTSTTVVANLSDNNQIDEADNVSMNSSSILNTEPNTVYDFTYDLTGIFYQVVTTCMNCEYELELTITDPCGELIDMSFNGGTTIEKVYRQTYSNNAVNCGTSLSGYSNPQLDFSATFTDLGNYTLTKKLTVSRANFEVELQNAINSAGLGQSYLNNLVANYQSAVDVSDCDNLCNTPGCEPNYTTLTDELASSRCEAILDELRNAYSPGGALHIPGSSSAQIEAQLMNDSRYCQYPRCTTLIASNAYDQQLGLVETWPEAQAAGYDDPLSGNGQDPSTVGSNNPIHAFLTTELGNFQGTGKTLEEYVRATNHGQSGLYPPGSASANDPDRYKWIFFRGMYLNLKQQALEDQNINNGCTDDDLDVLTTPPDYSDQAAIDQTISDAIGNLSADCGTICENNVANWIRMLEDRTNFGDLNATCQTDIETALETYCATSCGSENPLGLLIADGSGPYAVLQGVIDNCGCVVNAADCDNFCEETVAEWTKVIEENCSNPGGIGGMVQALETYCSATCASNVFGLVINDGSPEYNAISNNCGTDKLVNPYSGVDCSAGQVSACFLQMLDFFNQEIFPNYNGEFNPPPIVPSQYPNHANFFNNCVPSGSYVIWNIGNIGIVGGGSGFCPLPTIYTSYQGGAGLFPFADIDFIHSPYVDPAIQNSWNIGEEIITITIDLKSGGSTTAYYFNFPSSPPFLYCVDISPSFIESQICVPNNLSANYTISDVVQDAKDDCVDWILDRAAQRAQEEYNNLIAEFTSSFLQQYDANCLAAPFEENLYYSFTSKEYQYTLYYYDQAGNLVQTVAPEGVNLLPNSAFDGTGKFTGNNPVHDYATHYTYNSFNQVVKQQTPDAGITDFYYNDNTQLRFSVNDEQANDNYFSFTKYDAQGRIIEVGESANTSSCALGAGSLAQRVNLADYPTQGWQRTYTYYDGADLTAANASEIQEQFAHGQQNLRNRVVTSKYVEGATGFCIVPPSNPNVLGDNEYTTYYSYDVHGNVNELLHEENVLKDLVGAQHTKIDYNYDLISGNVNEVIYQKYQPDQLTHRYHYDADNRITEVWSTQNGFVWENDANYFYHLHGPLARMEVGHDKVQGMDYAYTLQGWLKGVNSNALRPEHDMGTDGLTLANNLNSLIALDEHGFSLGYFDNDYNSIGATSFLASGKPAAVINSTFNNLYNGNISHMATAIKALTQPIAYHAYQYDQLNRIKEMKVYTDANIAATNSFASAVLQGGLTNGDYYTHYDYDKNGNIMSLQRNGNQGLAMDDLSYTYYPDNNRLDQVNDNVNAANFTTDIDNVASLSYDDIGNLTQDPSEEIESIEWTVSGKVKTITRTSGSTRPNLEFGYDASGNRIYKIVKPQSSSQDGWTYHYYKRDAQGNVMANYETTFEHLGGTSYKAVNKLTELPLYGSSRVGVIKNETVVEEMQFNANIVGGMFDPNVFQLVMSAPFTQGTFSSPNGFLVGTPTSGINTLVFSSFPITVVSPSNRLKIENSAGDQGATINLYDATSVTSDAGYIDFSCNLDFSGTFGVGVSIYQETSGHYVYKKLVQGLNRLRIPIMDENVFDVDMTFFTTVNSGAQTFYIDDISVSSGAFLYEENFDDPTNNEYSSFNGGVPTIAPSPGYEVTANITTATGTYTIQGALITIPAFSTSTITSSNLVSVYSPHPVYFNSATPISAVAGSSLQTHVGFAPTPVVNTTLYPPRKVEREMENKHYELTNHLGNVLATVSDRKILGELYANGMNSSFEPGELDVFVDNGFTSNLSTQYARTGMYSLRMTSPLNLVNSELIPVQPGDTIYNVEAWLYSEVQQTTGGGRICRAITDGNGVALYRDNQASQPSLSSNGLGGFQSWQYANLDVNNTSNAIVEHQYYYQNGTPADMNSIYLQVRLQTLGQSEIWFDDVSAEIRRGNNCFSLEFDGINNCAAVPSSPSIELNTDFTIEFWMKDEGLPSGQNAYILRKGLNAAQDYRVSFFNSSTSGLFLILSPVGFAQIPYPNDGEWHHVALVATSNMAGNIEVSYSIDGSPLVVSSVSPNVPIVTNNPLRIGKFTNGGSVFKGKIDELRIWNAPRTEAQIQANYNKALRGNEPNLGAYYRFNEGGGTMIYDLTANANHGTLGGITTTAPTWSTDAQVCDEPVFGIGNENLAYEAQITSAQDYFMGGSIKPNSSNTGINTYRYGYNEGSEKDDEITGVTQSHFTTKYREGDTRLLRWWSVDPRAAEQPGLSPYSYMNGNPVFNSDPHGDMPPITGGTNPFIAIAEGFRQYGDALLSIASVKSSFFKKDINIKSSVNVGNFTATTFEEKGTAFTFTFDFSDVLDNTTNNTINLPTEGPISFSVETIDKDLTEVQQNTVTPGGIPLQFSITREQDNIQNNSTNSVGVSTGVSSNIVTATVGASVNQVQNGETSSGNVSIGTNIEVQTSSLSDTEEKTVLGNETQVIIGN